MTEFTIHTPETAPKAALPSIEKATEAFGMLPNVLGVMATSPELLDSYLMLHNSFQNTSLSVTERNVVWMVINVENQCQYCVPAHAVIAKMQGLDNELIQQLYDGVQLSDARLEILRQFTLKIVRQHGQLATTDVQVFLDAGFTQRHILDVILGVAQKTISNYVNHFANTPLDAPFAERPWETA